MILETWIMPTVQAGSSTGLGDTALLKLLRLLRLSRMARLMRAVPELMIMVRGMVVATRSVSSTLMLLLLITYVFAIMFKVQIGDHPLMQDYFDSIPSAMW